MGLLYFTVNNANLNVERTTALIIEINRELER